jgi:hypothetical protein
MVAGRRHVINAQTGTSYTTVLADQGKMITRSNAGASTHDWPSHGNAAIPTGTLITVANIGAGTVTHQAGSGAGLVAGGTFTQVQGQIVTAVKVGTGATGTWLIS